MVNLKCGCKVNSNGCFILGNNCLEKNCKECQTVSKIHPFGDKRFKKIELPSCFFNFI